MKNKISKYNYSRENDTRHSRKKVVYICNNCKSKIVILDDQDVNMINNGICNFCRIGFFVKE